MGLASIGMSVIPCCGDGIAPACALHADRGMEKWGSGLLIKKEEILDGFDNL